MKELKERLLELETQFEKIKAKTERNHIIFIIAYFIPPTIAILILNKFYMDLLILPVKIALSVILFIGLAIHFSLRRIYHLSKNRFKKFITNGLDKIAVDLNIKKDFNKKIVEISKQIFADKGQELSNITIKNNAFWELVFINLEIEFDKYE